MYVESLQLLSSIDKQRLNKTLLCDYYETFHTYYSHYGQSTNNLHYFRMSDNYRDSLLSCLAPQSTPFKLNDAIKQFYSADKNNATQLFLSLLSQTPADDPQRAVTSLLLRTYLSTTRQYELQEYYFASQPLPISKYYQKITLPCRVWRLLTTNAEI